MPGVAPFRQNGWPESLGMGGRLGFVDVAQQQPLYQIWGPPHISTKSVTSSLVEIIGYSQMASMGIVKNTIDIRYRIL